MTRRPLGCDEAALRLLEIDDGALPPELAAHVEECSECSLVARDVAAFRALVADARADANDRLPAIDVMAHLGAAAPAGGTDTPRSLRLVQGGAAGPVAPAARPPATPHRVLPIAIAVAASLVAVTTAAVLLRDDTPPTDRQARVVLRATGERPDAPARAPEPPEEPAVAITPPAPPPPAPPDDRNEGPKEPAGHVRRGTPAGSEPPSSIGSNSPAQSTTGDPDREAQSTLRRQMPRLQNCYERALRRDLRLGDASADLTVDIAPDGGVQTVAVSGDATPELRRCLEQAVRNARFPGSDSGLRVSVPLRFEVVRERMGTNIAPNSTVRQ